MAKKIQVKIDFNKVKGAFKHSIQGKNEKKECVCLPLDMFYQGKNGSLYLNFAGYETTSSQYGQLYGLKQQFAKKEFAKLSEDEKKNIPFCGDITENTFGNNNSSTASADDLPPAEGDMPF